jgi:DnaK suppressor protein
MKVQGRTSKSAGKTGAKVASRTKPVAAKKVTKAANGHANGSKIKVKGVNGAKHAGGLNGIRAAAQPKTAKVNGKAAKGRNAARIPLIELPPNYRPTEREPFMNEMQRLYFRKKLLAWKDDILRSTRETLQNLHDESAHFADVADRAMVEADKALELRARDRQRKLVAKIDSAIIRIEKGTYGYCEETGEPISLKRLDARPIATLSIEAQERHERRERVYRDE